MPLRPKNPKHRAPIPLVPPQEPENELLEYTGNPMSREELSAAIRAMTGAINERGFGVSDKGFLLADGTGVGKTPQILSVAKVFAEDYGNPVLSSRIAAACWQCGRSVEKNITITTLPPRSSSEILRPPLAVIVNGGVSGRAATSAFDGDSDGGFDSLPFPAASSGLSLYCTSSRGSACTPADRTALAVLSPTR